MKYDYNVIVIGAGAAGLSSAYLAAALKAKVALIERHAMGGDCLNTGCVPSKALIASAKAAHHMRHAGKYGFSPVTPQFDFADVMARVHAKIAAIAPHDSVERYSGLGVDCIRGEAFIRDPHMVEVGGRKLSTRYIIVATGAKPLVPNIPGLEGVTFYTSDTIWNLRELPKRLAVLGGGPIGCELAQAFARLGAEVSVIEIAPRLLIKEDPEISRLMEVRFAAEGIAVHTGTRAVEARHDKKGQYLICEQGEKSVELPFDTLLLALGRKANVTGFGLEELGVRLRENQTVEADAYLRTNIKNILVCGDVTGPFQFTHSASHQAWYCIANSLFSPLYRSKADYSALPWCTYTDPEIARVGVNEQDAQAKGIAYEVTTYPLDDLDRAIAEDATEGFVRVLTKPGKDRILGVTIAGDRAGDLMPEFVLAMRKGMGLGSILGTIHSYPTFAEANKYAAGKWKREHAPLWALRLLTKYHRWRR